MTPEELTAAANALVTATQGEAMAAGQQNEAAAAELAPGLATGSNAPGGRNYQANVAPLVPALTDQFITNARQAAFREAIRGAMEEAQLGYDTALSGYRQRQRNFQVAQAERSRERQRRSDAQAAAVAAAQRALASGGGGFSIGGVDLVTDQYIGNNDYRGRLNWLAQNAADQSIRNAAATALKYVGNDMQYKLDPNITNPEIINALTLVGATNVWNGGGGGPLPRLLPQQPNPGQQLLDIINRR